MLEFKDSNFHEKIKNSDQVVVVDFWAPWCGPCRMLTPVMEEISENMSGKMVFGKVNVDENPVTANEFRVASIPTVLVFKNGEVVESMVGFRPKEQLMSVFERHI